MRSTASLTFPFPAINHQLSTLNFSEAAPSGPPQWVVSVQTTPQSTAPIFRPLLRGEKFYPVPGGPRRSQAVRSGTTVGLDLRASRPLRFFVPFVCFCENFFPNPIRRVYPSLREYIRVAVAFRLAFPCLAIISQPQAVRSGPIPPSVCIGDHPWLKIPRLITREYAGISGITWEAANFRPA